MATRKLQKVENDRSTGSWSDLPEEILSVIKNKLHSSTLIRFRAVCKRWRQMGNKKRPITNLPWPVLNSCKPLLTTKPSKFIMKYKLYDPHEGKIHKVYFELPESSSYLTYNHKLQYKSRVFASRKGWVLVEEESPVSQILNLYNPFAKHVIPLPGTFIYEVDAATFSAIPTSPDCVFFVSFHCNGGNTHIGTYRFADDDWSWSTYLVPVEFKKKSVVKSVVYVHVEAMLYFIFQDGTLGKFDFLDEKWEIFWGSGLNHPIESVHLVESGGELLLAAAVVYNQDEDFRGFQYDYSWKVYGFDRSSLERSNWKWASKSLAGQTLFVSDASFCVPAAEAGEDTEDCVCYFFRNNFWRIYSLRDQWYKLPESLGWHAIEGAVIEGSVEQIARNIWSIEDSWKADVERKSVWIDPPCLED